MDWVIPYGKGRVYTTMLGHLWKDGPNGHAVRRLPDDVRPGVRVGGYRQGDSSGARRFPDRLGDPAASPSPDHSVKPYDKSRANNKSGWSS